jgi:1-acyl-sn-glycerol-3-phosphate acyltransferase
VSDGASTRGPTRAGAGSTNGAGPDQSTFEAARERVARAPLPAADIGSAARLLGGLAAGGASAVAGWATSRVRTADLDDRDPDYIREWLPAFWLAASLYFRAEVRGLHKLPEEGGVLLVGNHSGGNLTPDSLVFSLAFNTYFGVERGFYQLAHNLVLSLPGLSWMRKHGTIAASHENAHEALSTGNALLVYPGGDYEVHRPSWESAKVDFGGRKGFIRLALDEDVPIVPVVSIGGQETALFLSRGEWLARLLQLDKMFRLKVLPINLSVPWGLVIGDFFGRIPLPAKIAIEVLDPIHLRDEFGKNPDHDEVYETIVSRMQASLTALQAERRLPVIG